MRFAHGYVNGTPLDTWPSHGLFYGELVVGGAPGVRASDRGKSTHMGQLPFPSCQSFFVELCGREIPVDPVLRVESVNLQSGSSASLVTIHGRCGRRL